MKRLAIATALLVGLAGCSGKNPLTGSGTVVYKVTGTAGKVDITYSGSGGSTLQQSNVSTPWSTNIAAHSGDFLYVSAQNDGETGCVEVQIVSGSSVLKDGQSCGAFVVATVSTTY